MVTSSASIRAALETQWKGYNQLRKWYSQQATRHHETVKVPCRSNSEITLNVHHPLKAAPNQEAIPRILIYLPRGPLFASEEQEAANVAQLSQRLPSHHLVQVNYRLSEDHPYPAPIHDTLTGFDWVLENVLRKRAISRPGRATQLGKIGVCGELVGGGLASMLALTECRAEEPGIEAAAINNPIVDWVSLEKLTAPAEEGGPGSNFVVDKLLTLRSRLFTKPGKYFDPFASTMLLFRTAGVDTPTTPAATPVPEVFEASEVSDAPLDEMAQLSLLEREDYANPPTSATPPTQSAHEDMMNALLHNPTTPTRKASRRFPSASLNLRLPAFHISSGSTDPFLPQAEELAHVLRQSLIRQSTQTGTGSSFGRKVLLEDEFDEFEGDDEKRVRQRREAEARGKARLHRAEGLGLWDATQEGRQRLENVALWFKERMG